MFVGKRLYTVQWWLDWVQFKGAFIESIKALKTWVKCLFMESEISRIAAAASSSPGSKLPFFGQIWGQPNSYWYLIIFLPCINCGPVLITSFWWHFGTHWGQVLVYLEEEKISWNFWNIIITISSLTLHHPIAVRGVKPLLTHGPSFYFAFTGSCRAQTHQVSLPNPQVSQCQ